MTGNSNGPMVKDVRLITLFTLFTGVVLTLTAGCRLTATALHEQFQSEDPVVRAEAAVRAGDLKDPQNVAYLIDRLTDSERAVRFYAIVALEKITGRTMGYNHYDPRAQRQQAVERWKRWLEQGQPDPGATSGPAEDTQP